MSWWQAPHFFIYINYNCTKAKGAYIATTASERNHEFLKAIEADEVFDYRKVKFADVLSDYDLVLDTQGRDTLDRSYDVLKAGGRLTIATTTAIPGKNECLSIRYPRKNLWLKKIKFKPPK
ncbi:zinc-binding dehydrogenase [Pontibacter flavimaris]|uniref:Alcohol dehydrogenase-like C-terminal domain-containing protein n=1 Tax=Pontibacter flavimaris TaxID=1797110 RepID=A0A1Q5PE29_9BACT|nr:hypothetical protein A3841_19660 [Pontibacter flavimaris]